MRSSKRANLQLSRVADASIKATGLIQPLIVRPVPGFPHQFEVVAGERRLRAAQLAGLADIPAIIREFNDQEALAVSLIENIQREELSPADEARALKRLIEEFALTHEQVAQAIGLSTSGTLQGVGVGATTEGFSFAKVSTLGVGGASIANQYFAVLPIRQGFSVAFGVPVDGLIGFEVLARIWPSPRDYERRSSRKTATVAPVQQASGDRVLHTTRVGQGWGRGVRRFEKSRQGQP